MRDDRATGDWLAIDWGTSRRRAWRLSAAGDVVAAHADDRGVLAIPPGGFPAELDRLRGLLGDLPAIAAGSVTSATLVNRWVAGSMVAVNL